MPAILYKLIEASRWGGDHGDLHEAVDDTELLVAKAPICGERKE